MKRKEIVIHLNEIPKEAMEISSEVVGQFQKRLSVAMEKVNNDFARSQKITDKHRPITRP